MAILIRRCVLGQIHFRHNFHNQVLVMQNVPVSEQRESQGLGVVSYSSPRIFVILHLGRHNIALLEQRPNFHSSQDAALRV